MSAQKETVTIEGLLKGPGREAQCIVQGLKVSLADNAANANYKIIAVSEDLPRGLYQLVVNGQTFDVRETDLGWILA